MYQPLSDGLGTETKMCCSDGNDNFLRLAPIATNGHGLRDIFIIDLVDWIRQVQMLRKTCKSS